MEEVQYNVAVSDDARDNISEKESKLLNEMKENPETKEFPDRYLMMFLLSFECDVSKALKSFLATKKWMKDHGFEGKEVNWKDIDPNYIKMNHQFILPSTRDKNGGLIHYYILGRAKMKEFALETHLMFAVLLFQLHAKQPLNAHRKGITVIENLSHFNFKSFDRKISSILNELQEILPIRNNRKAILLMDAGSVFNFGFGVTKKLMSSNELVKRVRNIFKR